MTAPRTTDGNGKNSEGNTLDSAFLKENLLGSDKASGSVGSNETNHEIPVESKRAKIGQSMALYVVFLVGTGLPFFGVGPCLLDLKILTGSTTQEISYVFTARSVGFLIGGCVEGFFNEHKNPWLTMGVGAVVGNLLYMLAPQFHGLWSLVSIMTLHGLCYGVYSTCILITQTRIWGKNQGPWMQGLQMVGVSGGVVAPLLAEPFLSDYVPTVASIDHEEEGLDHNHTHIDVGNAGVGDVTNVKYFFVTVGALGIVSTVGLWIVFWSGDRRVLVPPERRGERGSEAGAREGRERKAGAREEDGGSVSVVVVEHDEDEDEEEGKVKGNKVKGECNYEEEDDEGGGRGSIEEKGKISTGKKEQCREGGREEGEVNGDKKDECTIDVAKRNGIEIDHTCNDLYTEEGGGGREVEEAEKVEEEEGGGGREGEGNKVEVERITDESEKRGERDEEGEEGGRELVSEREEREVEAGERDVEAGERVSEGEGDETDDEDGNDRKEDGRALRTTILALMFTFYMLLSVYGRGYPNYTMAFTVEYLGWQKLHGALLTSLYLGVYVLGRGIGILLIARVSPQTIIVSDLVVSILATLPVLLAVHRHPAVYWLSTLLYGLGNASLFGAGFPWLAQYFKMSGRVGSVPQIGGFVGDILGPPLIGYLFEYVTPMGFIYAATAGGVLCLILINIMHVLGKRYARLYAVESTVVLNVPEDR